MEDAFGTRAGQRVPHGVGVQQVELGARRRDGSVPELREQVLPDEPARHR